MFIKPEYKILSLCLGVMFLIGLLPQISAAGSLFDAETYQGLTSDNRARKAGDTLTVFVVETAAASSQVDSNSNRKTGIGASVSSNKVGTQGALNLNSNYQNGGVVTRSGKLLAKVTVVVDKVMPNGDLQVRGEQIIKINKEKQKIKISGLVNAGSIRADNTVVSSAIANMDVIYSGEGPLGREKKPGLIIRIFRWLF